MSKIKKEQNQMNWIERFIFGVVNAFSNGPKSAGVVFVITFIWIIIVAVLPFFGLWALIKYVF